MITALDTLRETLAGKSPVLGALFSSGLGLAAEATSAVGTYTNPIVVVALCGAAGAFFGSLPRIIAAMSGSRSALSKELRLLLDRTHRLEQRVILEQNGKHIMQSEHNNLALHITRLEALLSDAGMTVPVFKIKSYEEMLGTTNRQIKSLMLGDAPGRKLEEAAE